MKRLFFVVLVLLLVMPGVSGLSLTFQDSSEFGAYVTCIGTGSCTYSQSPNGGNSYIITAINGGAGSYRYQFLLNSDPQATTYAAATRISGGSPAYTSIRLYDSGLGTLYTFSNLGSASGRYEVIISGGVAHVYLDDKLQAVSTPLAQNPSYVGFGASMNLETPRVCYWDDFVYGTTENRYIFGSPEQGYMLKKDMLNPAASGFYYPNGTLLISSNNMSTQWSSGDTNASQTIILKEWSSAPNAWTYTTTTGSMTGSIAWPLQEAIFNNPDAPYGYYITTIAGSGEVSSVIPYTGGGGGIAWGSNTYARGDTATLTYSVDAGYWDTLTYAYRIDVKDVYGNTHSTYPVTVASGTKSVTFASDDTLGVYFAALIATPLAGGDDVWMAADYTELSGYLIFKGPVIDGETGLEIPTANTTICQGSVCYISVGGNYITNVAFYSGFPTVFNITATGYYQRYYSKTPLEAKTIALPFVLDPIAPTCTGVCLHGITTESVYGRNVPFANITAVNATHAENNAVDTNVWGYYEMSEDDGIFLTSGRCYLVTAGRLAYSTNATLRCLS